MHDYYSARVISQGSAYLYLHGVDGVPRDQVLFAIAAVYLVSEVMRNEGAVNRVCDGMQYLRGV